MMGWKLKYLLVSRANSFVLRGKEPLHKVGVSTLRIHISNLILRNTRAWSCCLYFFLCTKFRLKYIQASVVQPTEMMFQYVHRWQNAE